MIQVSRRHLLAVATLCAGGARASAAADRPATIVVGAPLSPSCIELMNAVAGPYFRAAAIDARLLGLYTGAAAMSALIGGQSDLIRCSALDVVHAAGGHGAPVVAIATTTRASGFVLLSGAARPVHDAASLRGARVGIFGPGSTTDLHLDMTLRWVGLPLEAVERQTALAGPLGSYTLIEQGRLDCVIETASAVAELVALGKPVVVWNTDAAAPLPGRCFATTRDRIAADPDFLAACLRAIRASMRDIFASDGLAAAVGRAGEKFGVPTARDTAQYTARARTEIAMWTLGADGPDLHTDPAAWLAGCNALAELGLFRVPPSDAIVTNAIVDRL